MGSIENTSTMDSANRIENGSFPLRIPNLPDLKTSKCENPLDVATEFVNKFNKAAKDADVDPIVALFQAQSYWRDQLCLSWDFRTVQGPDKIASLLKQTPGSSELNQSLWIPHRHSGHQEPLQLEPCTLLVLFSE
jgi:hypothetical protein